MARVDFIAARYGDAAQIFVSSSQRERCEVRQRDIWRSLTTILGRHVREPLSHEVHSPRALPAFLGFSRSEPEILWDAGIGTLFDQLSFTMPYPQPPDVVEAIVRRVAAIRCVVAGHNKQGAAQVLRAESLLKRSPIDRGYQMEVDAEDQFEVFLLSELQERFALAHELAHYLKAVENAAFEDFSGFVLDQVRRARHEERGGVLRHTAHSQSPPSTQQLYAANLDPYAWYLHTSPGVGHQLQHWPSPGDDMQTALGVFESSTESDREEIMCDLLGAVAVALSAHDRQAGWSAIGAAACSRLALSNLGTIIGIDAWVNEGGSRGPSMAQGMTRREMCMNAFGPVVIPATFDRHGRACDVEVDDLHSLMHLVQHKFLFATGAALDSLDWVTPSDDAPEMDDEEIILLAGFLYLRPPADHREAARAANRSLFDTGTVQASQGIYFRCTTEPAFAELVDDAIRRHQRGDWSHLPAEDREANERGLFEEFEPPTERRVARRGSIWSMFDLGDEAIFIITASDRATTAVHFASEH